MIHAAESGIHILVVSLKPVAKCGPQHARSGARRPALHDEVFAIEKVSRVTTVERIWLETRERGTIRPGLAPSEQVVAIALRNTLPDFLAADDNTPILVKFIRSRLDLSRTEGNRLAA